MPYHTLVGQNEHVMGNMNDYVLSEHECVQHLNQHLVSSRPFLGTQIPLMLDRFVSNFSIILCLEKVD